MNRTTLQRSAGYVEPAAGARSLQVLPASDSGNDDEPALRYDQQSTALRAAALAVKRGTSYNCATETRIDDTVLRGIQARPDVEDSACLAAPLSTERL